MTIKQQGGIFGRNPTFNNVDVDGTFTGTTGEFSTSLEVNGGSGIKTAPYGWGSEFGSLDVGNGGSFSSYDAGGFPAVYITSNAYNNNTNWIANVTDQSCLLILEGTTGNIKFSSSAGNTTAGSPVTFVEHMVISSNGNATLNNGNIVIGTSGKGIDFSATAGTGTSELFDDYEEGTWTPTQGDFVTWTGTPTFNATYIKIGRIVTVSLTQTGGTISGNALQYIGGLPFTPKTGLRGTSTSSNANVANVADLLAWDDGNIYVVSTTGSQASWCFSITYEVA